MQWRGFTVAAELRWLDVALDAPSAGFQAGNAGTLQGCDVTEIGTPGLPCCCSQAHTPARVPGGDTRPKAKGENSRRGRAVGSQSRRSVSPFPWPSKKPQEWQPSHPWEQCAEAPGAAAAWGL